ncbi:MAG: diguanylate cyclase, partial [Kosmotogaceae bacterium]|nr:diguanylate cyclase [Kosmotogaceae bacterium]
KDFDGFAVIYEKDTGLLIANSMGVNNFSFLSDGTFKRLAICEIDNSVIRQVCSHYDLSQDPSFTSKDENGKLFVGIREVQMPGVDWVLLVAIPETHYMTSVIESVNLTVLLVVLALVFSVALFFIFARKLMKPVNDLLQVSEAFSSGDLSRRVKIVRNDEIGTISTGFNRVADKMQFLINNLEDRVVERTKELHKVNAALEESKNQLQLLLDSTAEGIYGIDLDGNCTFCNASAARILGYSSIEELLGKNMHLKLHHSRRDGTVFPADDCKIIRSIKQGRGFKADDEVFWRADGTSFDVEYHSYPQIRDGKVVGGVITFMDITERKKREEEIRYLSCHDSLTGLHNRSCFENNRKEIDKSENLPMSVIFADINGLKMTNDVFGHAAGDELLRKSAEVLNQTCREGDVIVRAGGDEFIILLPKTDKEEAEKILSRIKIGFSNTRVEAMKCSVSLGLDTKTSIDQPLEVVMANAENSMYKDKTMNRKSSNREIINSIIETLHSKHPREKQHSITVRELCGQIGSALNLSVPEISVLKRAGYLHDIGKIVLDESILSKDSSKALTGEEREKMRQHSVVGYRILNLFDDTLDLAEYAYSHHERWDGKGYPRGLEGEQIPLISRIISVAEAYERVLNRGDNS